MNKPTIKINTIHKKLTIWYGSIMSLILLVTIIFSIIIISKLRVQGIDEARKQSINRVSHYIESLIGTTNGNVYELIENFILSENEHNPGNVSIINEKGEIIFCPDEIKENIQCFHKAVSPLLSEIKEQGSGKVYIEIENCESFKGTSVLYFTFSPEMDWLIVDFSKRSEIYSPIQTAYIILTISLILSVLTFLLLNSRLSRHLTMPLKELIAILESNNKEKLTIRSHARSGDELEILGRHFNRFMDEQEAYINKLELAKNEIEILARFPAENPNPVIRVSGENRIEYANDSAMEQILNPFGLKIGSPMEDDLFTRFTNWNPLYRRNEMEVNDQVFTFSISKISDPEGIYLYGRDITRQKRFESLQLLSENIFKNSIEGILITDKEGHIESVNPAFTAITLYSEEEVLGENPRILKSHRHSPDFYQSMWDGLIKKGYWSGEIWNKKKNGKEYPELLTITSEKDEEGEIIRFISFFHDLSDVKEKEERILYESTHDKLTGLPNRQFLIANGEEIIKKAEGESEGFAIVYVDILNFKRINESIGMESGDQLLIQVASRLAELLNGDHQLIHAGSDEFICLINKVGHRDDINAIVEQIFREFDTPFGIKDREIDLNVSIGISLYPDDERALLELVSKAEEAMRASKSNVNSRFSFYSPNFKKGGLSRLEIETALKAAFENQDFFLNYQPKVSAQTGKVIGSEALVRVHPIEGQNIGPEIFIPIAEEIGLIEPLGTWVLEKACLDTISLMDTVHSDLHVAVNLSPWQFRNDQLVTKVSNIIKSVGIDPAKLNLEITESMAIDDVEASIRMMQRLTDIGLTLSIDDFGTGYSSLSYISRFPVDILKIDKVFVDGIPNDPKKTGIVMAIMALAQNLGMKTVAEGVETIDHYHFLKEKGCDQIQGYYFYKPVVFEKYQKILTNDPLDKANHKD